MSGKRKESHRIAKLIASSGFCSRRDAEIYIKQGLVYVDDVLVKHPSEKFPVDSKVQIGEQRLRSSLGHNRTIWKFYKPKGCITASRDAENRKTIFDFISGKVPSHVMPVGRLDYNSEGLLLLTNSGEFARAMEMPENEIKRTYKVRARGILSFKDINRAAEGLRIKGVHYKPMEIEALSDQENSNNWYLVTLHEGKNREIRKVFAYFGLEVNRLIRLAYGKYELGKMKPGEIIKVD